MSFLSSPPSRVKNFIPLRLKGKWLAVSIIAPSAFVSSKTVDINIAGVEASPQSKTFTPFATNALITAVLSFFAVILESCPIAIFKIFFCSFFSRKMTNPAAIRLTASSVKFTVSPATPSTAIPRTSLPFCSLSISFSLSKVQPSPRIFLIASATSSDS